MHHAMRSSATLAVAVLLGTASAEAAAPDKPEHPAKAQSRDNHGKAGADEGAHGKSAEAHAAAPGQGGEPRGKSGEAKPTDSPGRDKGTPEERAQTRDQRRKQHREELKAQYGGDVLKRPPILAELKTHAWRMARLDRMRTLAEAIADAGKRKKTLARVDELVKKEQTRHDRHMEQLRNQNAATAGQPPEGSAKPAAPERGPEKHEKHADKAAEKAGGQP